MEFLLTISLILLIYLSAILLVSFIMALFAMRKGTANAKRVFKDVFWDFFAELLNPFNWL